MSLEQLYDAAIASGVIENEPLQRELLIPMQQLADALNIPKSWFSWRSKKAGFGLYIYGSVGVGKTYLVDLFYEYITESKKARFHFHHFMQQIDAQLRKLQGQKNPIQVIAKNIAASTSLLCFDEFLVHDVAYAMILAELIPALYIQGVILVISSNTKPDDLYINGVQRPRFLPVITLLKKHNIVFFLNQKKDHRLGRPHLQEAYFYPLNKSTAQAMEKQFTLLAKQIKKNSYISVQNREIPFLQSSERSIWFAFDILCNLPRSQLDYLEIADRFDTIFISELPRLTEHHTLQVIMFIHFIDVMYDRGVNVIISAAVPLESLYVKGEMYITFQRTLSRLYEMQSVDYLRRHPHRTIKLLA